MIKFLVNLINIFLLTLITMLLNIALLQDVREYVHYMLQYGFDELGWDFLSCLFVVIILWLLYKLVRRFIKKNNLVIGAIVFIVGFGIIHFLAALGGAFIFDPSITAKTLYKLIPIASVGMLLPLTEKMIENILYKKTAKR